MSGLSGLSGWSGLSGLTALCSVACVALVAFWLVLWWPVLWAQASFQVRPAQLRSVGSLECAACLWAPFGACVPAVLCRTIERDSGGRLVSAEDALSARPLVWEFFIGKGWVSLALFREQSKMVTQRTSDGEFGSLCLCAQGQRSLFFLCAFPGGPRSIHVLAWC